MEPFRVRLNCIDHYQAKPTSYDPRLRKDAGPQKSSGDVKVPVIRVFGSTETGQKVCAHIHGAFPYLYVEYPEGLGLAADEVGAYIYRLHLSIDHALAVSYRRDVYKEKPSFVARITLVKGIPFYGFHVGYRFFLKIYMLSPVVMTRLADLLQQGLIMKRPFQPYEAHLQYLLQWMTDYNLYGCDYINVAKAMFRHPVPAYDDEARTIHRWHSRSVPASHITDEFNLPRASHCSIEVDICVQDIMNRHAVHERLLHHDFDERLEPPSDVKLVYSMAGLWSNETKRRKRRMKISNPGSSPFPPDVLVSMSADPRDSQPQGWVHEEEYKSHVKELIAEERGTDDDPAPLFDTFVTPVPLESDVQTALAAVEDLYPDTLKSALVLPDGRRSEGINPTGNIEVDEQGGPDVDSNGPTSALFPEDSDEELFNVAHKPMKAKRKPTSRSSKQPECPAVNGITETSGRPQTVSGTAGSKATTGHVPPLDVNGVLKGAAKSGISSGQLTNMPVFKELSQIAQRMGLVSRFGRALAVEAHRVQGDAHSKRPSSTIQASQPKRPRLKRQSLDDNSISTRADELHAMTKPTTTPENDNPVPKKQDDSQSRKPPSSYSSSRGSGNSILKFPVVKDPNDPSTRQRLSQQSSSQHSQEDQFKKHVSFDPFSTAPQEKAKSQKRASIASEPTINSSSGTDGTIRPQLPCNSLGQQGVVPALSRPPPTATYVFHTMQDHNLPPVLYQDAFYGCEKDVPLRPREYAGREFRLEGNTLPFLPEFDGRGESLATYGMKPPTAYDPAAMEREYSRLRKKCTIKSWELALPPPSFEEVDRWWQEKQQRRMQRSNNEKVAATQAPNLLMSQVDGPTPKNTHGFKYTQKQESTSVQHEAQYMSTMSLEVHVNTRGTLVPNPEEDEVRCIFWCLKDDGTFSDGISRSDCAHSGVIVLSDDGTLARRIQRQTNSRVTEEATELDVMVRMVEIVRTHDPDILTGYEVHGSSWGYLIERARLKYDYDLCDEFSRMKSQSHGRFGKDADKWGFNTTSTIRVTGRHMINIWRAMRGELNLLQYTMENVVWHLLHRRIPHYSWKTLTDWYTNGRQRDLSKMLRYYLTRTRLDLEILDRNELIPRTSEQARLLGVDFFSVFSRGSQFKVESIMFRIAKPENFLLVSPSRKQVGGQNALECLPLVMEPQSAFYSSPLLVLDFQSLYPSVMIAYNLCYSTFLGRIVNWRGASKMGFTEYKCHRRLVELLQDHINITPNGMMYCKSEIRKSLLAKMLTEILETRVMVKSGMKQDKEDKALQHLLNNRQLALKLLANVTYGYTSASFSGRMPCSEIADSIVQTARETLERAVALIHSVERWGAEVVYGDTDSLFIHLKGRTKDQAFDIGDEIAKTITDMNPRPVKLKFEKVYHPCVLLAKKRYVGYKYETKDQTKPEFDAKGIETVRRDGTPAEQKMEEKALRLLFETADLSRVKAYFQRQCDKMMRGAVSVQDFCFAREVRLGTYSDRGAPPPPGALVSTRRMLEDARAEPQYGERVPYVVVTGAPGARLIDRCVAPEELLADAHCRLDAEYYISKNLIPPLERIFNLVGANVRQWYDEMPKVQRVRRVAVTGGGGGPGGRGRKTLEAYLRSASCVVCGVKMKGEGAVCVGCARRSAESLAGLQTKLRLEEASYLDIRKVCQSCAGLAPLDEVLCDSKDCPVFYTRVKQANRLRAERSIVEPVIKQLAEMGIRKKALEW